MVERLKRSIEQLEPPECPNCHVEMQWYRSDLVAASDPAAIDHFFQCPNCRQIGQARKLVGASGPPDPTKLSKRAQGFSCAA